MLSSGPRTLCLYLLKMTSTVLKLFESVLHRERRRAARIRRKFSRQFWSTFYFFIFVFICKVKQNVWSLLLLLWWTSDLVLPPKLLKLLTWLFPPKITFCNFKFCEMTSSCNFYCLEVFNLPRICPCRLTVWPDVGIKSSPIFPKSCPKVATVFFTGKVIFSK